jgi:hypothetical protein
MKESTWKSGEPNFEAHLKRTGKRWEIEEAERRTAKTAAEKKAKRIAFLEENLPKWQAELKQLKGS